MILVNGGKGIGTGFSYEGLCYNLAQIIKYLKWVLKGRNGSTPVIEPYYEGFKGTITKIADIKDAMDTSKVYKKYLIKGGYKVIGVDKVQITELPIGVWTDDYKKFLESIIDDSSNKKNKKKQILKNYIDMSTDTEVDITLKLVPGIMGKLMPKKADYGCNQLEKALGMYTTRTTTNMNLFDSHQQLKKFTTIYEIMESYFTVRRELYVKRKEYQMKKLADQLVKLSNKARFIQEQIVEPPTLVLRKKKKQEVIELLKSKNYDIIDNDNEFKYLRAMPIDSVEEENVAKLLNEKGIKEAELGILKNKSIEQMWQEELVELTKQYNIYRNARIKRASGTVVKKIRKPRKKLIKIKK